MKISFAISYGLFFILVMIWLFHLILGVDWKEQRFIKKLNKICLTQDSLVFSMVPPREFYSINFKEIRLGWRSYTVLENDIFHMDCPFQPPALRTITKTVFIINGQNVMILVTYHDSLEPMKDRNYLYYNPDYDKNEINAVIKEAFQYMKREKKRNKNLEPNKTLFP